MEYATPTLSELEAKHTTYATMKAEEMTIDDILANTTLTNQLSEEKERIKREVLAGLRTQIRERFYTTDEERKRSMKGGDIAPLDVEVDRIETLRSEFQRLKAARERRAQERAREREQEREQERIQELRGRLKPLVKDVAADAYTGRVFPPMRRKIFLAVDPEGLTGRRTFNEMLILEFVKHSEEPLEKVNRFLGRHPLTKTNPLDVYPVSMAEILSTYFI